MGGPVIIDISAFPLTGWLGPPLLLIIRLANALCRFIAFFGKAHPQLLPGVKTAVERFFIMGFLF